MAWWDLTQVRKIHPGQLHDEKLISHVIGIAYLIVACAALFVGVQIMFEIREQELRQGIKMKC
jgi:hypothetical protein